MKFPLIIKRVKRVHACMLVDTIAFDEVDLLITAVVAAGEMQGQRLIAGLLDKKLEQEGEHEGGDCVWVRRKVEEQKPRWMKQNRKTEENGEQDCFESKLHDEG